MPTRGIAAAVLVPAYRDPRGALRVVLIRRVVRGIHGGQIAFPGGRAEPGDTGPEATALREAHEEIGLLPADVTVVTALPIVSTRSSGYEIRPFLGRIRPPPVWRPEPAEVSEVLTPTVACLRERARLTTIAVRLPTAPRRVPCLRLDDETVIWGATYRILRPLLARLDRGHWPL